MKCAAVVMFAALFSSLSYAAEEPTSVFKLSGWTYGRERKTITGSNRVTASVTVKNATKAGLSNVVATLTYTTGLGEKIAGPLVQNGGALKAGESKTLTFVAELVPAFQSYTISMQYNGGKKEEWFGNSDVAQPEVKPELMKGEANVVILGKETSMAKNGVFSGTVHVKNEGTEEATNLKIFVTFFDMRKNKVKDWNAPLGTGTLAGGADKNIPFSISGAPINYGSYSLKLNNDDAPPEAALSGGEFTSVQDVEFAHFKLHKAESGSAGIKVEAQCRNGMKAAVDHVKLEMVFYDGKKKEVRRFSHEFSGAIAPGEIKDVAFDIPNLPQYEEYEQRVTFGKAAPSAAKSPAQTGPLKFQDKPDVEIVFGQPLVNADKVLELKGAARNGKSVSVKDIQIHVIFTKADGSELTVVDRTLSSTMKPGDTKDFTFYSDKAVGAANFTFTFKCTELN